MVFKRDRSFKAKKLIPLVIGLIGFIAFSGSSLAALFQAGFYEGNAGQNVESDEDLLTQLELNEQGFSIVLKREPENQTALEGLARTRIQMDNIEGAIEPLEKVIQLNPNRQDLINLLNSSKASLQMLEN